MNNERFPGKPVVMKTKEAKVLTIPRWETFLLELHNSMRRLETNGLATKIMFPEINSLLEKFSK